MGLRCRHVLTSHRQLSMFDGTPAHLQDKAQLLHFYPYLEQPFNYDCTDDEWDQQFPEFSPGAQPDDLPVLLAAAIVVGAACAISPACAETWFRGQVVSTCN